MVKWLIAVVVVVALLVTGDVVARKYAESQIAHVIRTHEPGSTARARISSWPFVGRLAVSRQVQKVSVKVRQVAVTTAAANFTLDEVDMTLSDVKVNLGPLVAGSNGAVRSIRTGTVRAVMTQAVVSQIVHLPVTFGNGSAQVTVGGTRISGTVSVVNNGLRISGAGQTLTIPIPQLPVLPCIADVAISVGRLIMACTFRQVPTALLQVATG